MASSENDFDTPLYTSNEKSEKETKKIIIFTIVSKIKYLGINLTINVKDPYSENCKTLKKESKEDANESKHIPCSWKEELSHSKAL